MSVYTPVEQHELEAFLRQYDIGRLTGYEGISAGIENTNFFVNTDQGAFVLTIFEWLTTEELPYFLDLMAFLAEHGIQSAHPVADKQGHYLQSLKNKPAALVNRLPGKTIINPNSAQCAALGKALGKLHAEGQHFNAHRDNDRGPRWWRSTAERLYPELGVEEIELLKNEIQYQTQHKKTDLPRGVTHADLFRDNALFVGDELTGIIDFYYACNDVLLYDVAVTINDWCSNDDGSLDNELTDAILAAYHQQRPFQQVEKSAWRLMLRAAALRFWCSRLQDLHFPREGEITHIKNPDAMKQILLQRIHGDIPELP